LLALALALVPIVLASVDVVDAEAEESWFLPSICQIIGRNKMKGFESSVNLKLQVGRESVTVKIEIVPLSLAEATNL
jgi:hypothetical protein